MMQVKRSKIGNISMSVNIPEALKKSKCKLINPENGFVYEWVGLGWIKIAKATESELKTLPILLDD